MSGSEIFGPLLRPGLADLDHFFFAKCKFCIRYEAVKNFGACSNCLYPLNCTFSGGEGPFPRIEGPFPKLRVHCTFLIAALYSKFN